LAHKRPRIDRQRAGNGLLTPVKGLKSARGDFFNRLLADFVIAAAPKHASCLKVAARTRIAFQLVAPGGHCWPSAKLTWPRVLDLPLIVRERVSGIRVSLEEPLTHDRLIGRLRISAEVTTPELAIELVRAGFGVALVPYASRLAAYFAGLSVVDVPAGLEKKV